MKIDTDKNFVILTPEKDIDAFQLGRLFAEMHLQGIIVNIDIPICTIKKEDFISYIIKKL
jgi:hypothetical protein